MITCRVRVLTVFLFTAIDIDECLELNGGCQHSCEDTDGAYNCSCYDGFELSPEGHICQGKLCDTTLSPSAIAKPFYPE